MVLPVLSLLWFQWQLASDMLAAMNQKADPCVNFYEYACGNYVNKTNIPDDKPYVVSFTTVQDRVFGQLRDLMESNDTSSDDSPSAKFAKTYYRSCINTQALETVGLTPLKESVRKFGGWPIVDGSSWTNDAYEWIKTNAKILRETGISPIILFNVLPDLKNSTKYTLQIGQPRLGLGKRDYYVDTNNTKALDAYRKFISSTAVQLGADKTRAKEEANGIMEFETALATISVRDEERRDFSKRYKPMTVAELQKKYPMIDFKSWFEYATANDWSFDDSTIVNIESAQYLDELPKVLSNFSMRTIANYALWPLIQNLVQYLAPSHKENFRKFRQALSGASKFEPRWMECLTDMQRYVKWPLSSLYVKHYFNQDTKADVDRMIANIRKAMRPTIQEATWMDESTKQNALKKLSTMIDNMAFPPDEIYNDTWLMRDFQTANLHEHRYMENYLSVSASIESRRRREFYEAINRTQWNLMAPATVNAYYSSADNKMTFPAGILQYPFYNSLAPAYVNYAKIGAAMGHELTHGYDDQGRQFDAEGNYELWWTDDTLAKFKQGAKCFIDQYGSIVEGRTGQKLNGENTQGENIADNGGVKLAYKAYRLWQSSAGDSADAPNLPGFRNFTTNQLFFLSYGQIWCQAIRTQTLRQRIIVDPHAPSQYRTNVPLQNNEDFAAAFSCPLGSPMNPKEKCAIW